MYGHSSSGSLVMPAIDLNESRQPFGETAREWQCKLTELFRGDAFGRWTSGRTMAGGGPSSGCSSACIKDHPRCCFGCAFNLGVLPVFRETSSYETHSPNPVLRMHADIKVFNAHVF